MTSTGMWFVEVVIDKNVEQSIVYEHDVLTTENRKTLSFLYNERLITLCDDMDRMM